MIRFTIILAFTLFTALQARAMSWASVNVDAKTTAAITGALLAEYETENLNESYLQDVLKHYTSAEFASAGIFASKWMERKAKKDVGLFGDSRENYYYRRIYSMVATFITPKIWSVANLMVKHPDKALYWGPYLFRTTEEVKRLCATFETVVTNGRITFDDRVLLFLSISPDLQKVFDLAQLGGVDWKTMLDKFGEFGSGLTKDDLKADLDGLLTAGKTLAGAGGSILDSLWSSNSKVGNIFKKKPGELLAMYHNFKDLYNTVSDPARIKSLVMGHIQSTDSLGVARLLSPGGYNVTNYVSDYLQELQGRFYTQQWYIYCRDAGREVLCDYTPPTDDNSILYSDEWYRMATNDENFSPTSAELEMALQNSERFAGWSREQVRQLNASGDGYDYVFYSSYFSYLLKKKKSGLYAKAYAYYIQVVKSWNKEDVVYEELYDSRETPLSQMKAQMDARLEGYNHNDENKVYYIGKGKKNYYDAADEQKMKGVESVSYTVKCQDGNKLGEGAFSWKENGDQGGCLDKRSEGYAMESTLSGGTDLSEFNDRIQSLQSSADEYQRKIDNAEKENRELVEERNKASVEEGTVIMQKYNTNLDSISAWEKRRDNILAELKEIDQYRQQSVEDYANEEDGTYRIPAVMHTLESVYSIEWDDYGSWTGDCGGHTYVRHGRIPKLDGVLTFKAELKKTRDESHFLGIRYHRAILNVSWQLTSEYSSSDVVDILKLDLSTPEKDRAAAVNKRLAEIQREYPNCEVEMSYAQSTPPDSENDENVLHLLWISDRLRIARQVDARLTAIYAELVMIEKFMRSRQTILDYLKNQLYYTVDRTVVSDSIESVYKGWRERARQVSKDIWNPNKNKNKEEEI